MCACIYYLGMNPDAYKKLQQEIDSFYESQNLTDPISYNNAQQLSYLKAVVQESLRLFPSIMYQLLRISPGIVIDKQYIPPGYDIGISPRSQNRDRAVYGPDADDFRPERWLQSDEDTSALNRYNMTFGGNGPRTCIGKNIALVRDSTLARDRRRHKTNIFPNRSKLISSLHRCSTTSILNLWTSKNPGRCRRSGLLIRLR